MTDRRGDCSLRVIVCAELYLFRLSYIFWYRNKCRTKKSGGRGLIFRFTSSFSARIGRRFCPSISHVCPAAPLYLYAACPLNRLDGRRKNEESKYIRNADLSRASDCGQPATAGVDAATHCYWLLRKKDLISTYLTFSLRVP